MGRRPKLGRAVAAITGASVAVLLTALPATAQDPATATYSDKHEAGLDVNLVIEGQEDPEKLPTRLSEIRLDKAGPAVQTYGLIPTGELEKDTELVELPWPSGNDIDARLQLAKTAADDGFTKKINWVLRNSYPFVGVDTLSVKGIDKKEAIAATQAAIWHFFLGDVDLADDNPANVKALYKILTGDNNTGAENDAAPELAVAPATLSGKAGDKVGPVKVKTNAKELALSLPTGVKVTDKDGTELAVKDIKDGTELFFQLPAGAAGQGSVEVKVSAGISRLFVGGDEPELRTMTEGPVPVPFQFLAFGQKLSKSAEVKLSWTAADTGTGTTPQGSSGALADTGVSIYVPIGLGVLLLAAGAGALLYLRRRARA